MNSQITQWALRWQVPHIALLELNCIFGINSSVPTHASEDTHSEAYVQSLVRLEAARKGAKLWRNNVGVMMNESGQPVRFGLANDSPGLNKTLKSGDLIGWRSIVIGGVKVAQFVSRECKRPGWIYTGTDREKAQLRWAEAINADGGDAQFVTGEGTL